MIKLRAVYPLDNIGNPVWVNPDHVISFGPAPQRHCHSTIRLRDGVWYDLAETAEQVSEKITTLKEQGNAGLQGN